MIPRYDRKEISSLWSLESKYQTLLEVELAILQAQEGAKIPSGTADFIRKRAKINSPRIEEIEEEVRHDLIAFCTSITEQLPPDVGKYFHFGVTSSDIIDTATTLQIKRSLVPIRKSLQKLRKALLTLAQETKGWMAMGRSHGMYAEPLSFGQKWLGYYAEFSRRAQELEKFAAKEFTGQFSGAVGNYTILSPEEEEKALALLGLQVEAVSTQVLPRDRIAKLISIHALLAQALERLAVEIRHLHRSEISELHEGFKKGQKGSSTMPHKKNPIAAENLTGMARLLRSHVSIAHENIVLWHERDISHSSAERLYLPDNLGILFYALERTQETITNLQLHREKIEGQVEETHVYFSSFYLHQLLSKSDLSREEAYEEVQSAMFKSTEKGDLQAFFQELKTALEKRHISLSPPFEKPSFEDLKEIYLGHTEEVFTRALRHYPL